jgi:Xaa-Pro aminopeptidase
VLFGRTEAEMEDRSAATLQEPDFYYLTGWTQPGAVLLLAAESEVLFLPKHDAAGEVYNGVRAAASDSDARAVTGFAEVMAISQFEARLARELEGHARILTHTREAYAARIKSIVPLRELGEAAPVLAALRVAKSPAEIEALEHSAQVSVEAHRAAWRRMAPGLFEYQVAATMTYTMLDRGCEGNAYDPIVGSGINGTVLHYAKNSGRIEQGELILMDAAAVCGAYASDITRTVPVSGKFTPRQRELYDIVLGAYKAAVAAVKPGATMAQLTEAARAYMNAHGKDAKGEPLGKYLKHRVSHGVGLEVHDYPTASYMEPLREGMVITIEPGLYMPEERIGIRIEDTVLVTATGARVLSAPLPVEAAEIEKAMAK